MKKIGLFFMSVITMFAVVVGVNAQGNEVEVEDWDTLKTCLGTAQNVCKLKDDITEINDSSKFVVSVTDVTLDLAGHTLKLKENVFLRVNDNASLTITSSTDKKGTIDGSGVKDTPVGTYAGGSLVVDNVVLTKSTDDGFVTLAAIGGNSKTTKLVFGENAEIAGFGGIGVFPTSGDAGDLTVDVKGLVDVYSFAITTHGTVTSGNAVINIYDGAVLTSKDTTAIYSGGKATWNISGGVITGTNGIVARQGKVNITSDKVKVDANGDGTVARVGDAKADGGYVELPTGVAVLVDNTENTYPDVSKVEITDGEFDANIAAVLNYKKEDNDDKAISVKGGTFDQKVVAAYLESEDLGQSVSGKIGTVHSITVTGAKNGIVIAPTDAVKGEEVTVKITADKGYELDKLVVMTKSETEVKVTNGMFVMPDEDVTLTATFKATAKNPNTGDNIMLYVGVAGVSLVAILVAAIYLRKKTVNNK